MVTCATIPYIASIMSAFDELQAARKGVLGESVVRGTPDELFVLGVPVTLWSGEGL